jgi:excisionase family DNA binding protein
LNTRIFPWRGALLLPIPPPAYLPRCNIRARAAKRLGISVRHLSRVIAAGDLPVVRLGTRVVRISPADLDRYIAAKREGRSAGN